MTGAAKTHQNKKKISSAKLLWNLPAAVNVTYTIDQKNNTVIHTASIQNRFKVLRDETNRQTTTSPDPVQIISIRAHF